MPDVKPFGEWNKDVKMFCDSNNLSYEKAASMYVFWGIDFFALKPENRRSAPTVLFVDRDFDGRGRCQETEFTRQYLAQ